MLRRIVTLIVGAGWIALSAVPAAAQMQITGITPEASPDTTPGWTFTPSMVYSTGWDTNVLVQGVGGDVQGDVENLVGPAADVAYNSGRSQFQAHYSGGIELYRTLNTLDAYDQMLSAFGKRQVTKHFALFARESFVATPTTQTLMYVGVPFVRTGADMEDAQGGFEDALTKRLSVTGTYEYQWVKFDPTAYGVLLLGGHSYGGDAAVRYQLSARTAITVSADAQYAIVNAPLTYLDPAFSVQYAVGSGGTVSNFSTQTFQVGIERHISDTFRVFGSIGLSHLSVSNFAPAQTGPAWTLGLSKNYQRTRVDLTYSREYVPAFGFGGTLQNEELTGDVETPLTRRTFVSANAAWMGNQPLLPGQPNLDTIWIGVNLGYIVNPWLKVEGYFGGVHQTIAQPGGLMDRDQFGVQFVASKPVRIR